MKVKLKPSHENFPEDITRIQIVLINRGYECSREQAADLWYAYSNSLFAGWLDLPDPSWGDSDDTIWQHVEPYIEVDE